MIAYKISFKLNNLSGHFFTPESGELLTGYHTRSKGFVFSQAKEASQVILVKQADHIDGGLFRLTDFVIVPVVSTEVVEGNELPSCVIRLSDMQDQDCFVVGHIKAQDSGTDKDSYVALKVFDGE